MRLTAARTGEILAIVGSNLDEFFMVRVAGLKQQIPPCGRAFPRWPDPAEQLAAIRKAVSKLLAEARDCLSRRPPPTLAEAGIHILGYPDLDHRQQAYVKKYFAQVVFPV